MLKHEPELSNEPLPDNRVSNDSDSDGLPNIASLAIDVANGSDCIEDENIPPLDLGDSLELWENYWRAEGRNRPSSSASTLDGGRNLKEIDQSQTRPRTPSQHGRGVAGSDTSDPGTPQTALQRPTSIENRSSTSSSETAEIVTATELRFQRVKFVRGTGNGHYVDVEGTGNSVIPVVHARIIDTYARPRPPSPAITAIRGNNLDDNKPQESPKIWEEAVAAADARSESESSSRQSSRSGGVAIANAGNLRPKKDERRKTLREVSPLESTSRGRRLVTFVNGQSVSRSISPIPIDYYKFRPRRTPSVSSHGSQFDRSSPTFAKLCRVEHHTSPQASPQASPQVPPQAPPKLRPASLHLVPQEKISLRDRTIGWLKNVVSPRSRSRTVSAQPISPRSPRSFKVFSNPFDSIRVKKRQGRIIQPGDIRRIGEHEPVEANHLGQTGNVASKTALKDVTNLRKPNYLEHNSFFQDSRALDPISPQKVSGISMRQAYESASATTRARLEGYVVDTSRPRQPLRPAPAAPHIASPAPVTMVAIEETLAKLEGRANAPQALQFRRNNRSESDLVSEGKVAGSGATAGRRSSWNVTLEQWKSTFGSVDTLPSIESGNSARARRGVLDRPSDPTLGAGHWFYEAEQAYGRNRD